MPSWEALSWTRLSPSLSLGAIFIRTQQNVLIYSESGTHMDRNMKAFIVIKVGQQFYYFVASPPLS